MTVSLRPRYSRGLKWVAKCQCLKIRQYQRLIGRSYSVAAGDLKFLADHGFLEQAQVYDTANAAPRAQLNPEVVYALTDKAVQRCRQDGYLDDSAPLFTPQWGEKTLTDKDVFHRLGVIDCQTAMLASIRKPREIVSMIPDFLMRGKGSQRGKVIADTLSNGQRIEPDCVAVIRNNADQSEVTLFVEYERKSRALKRFAEKLRNYDAYFAQKNRRHNRGAPMLLFVVVDDYRVQALIGAEDAWREAPKLRKTVRIGFIDDLHDDFFGGAWVDGFGKPLPIIRSECHE
jgi:hypothetical protein